jgi:hypothetical protein
MSRRKTRSLKEVIDDLLPDIDEVFAAKSEPLYSRPYRAAMLVVEACVVNVAGDTKDHYHTKAWFGAILTAVNEWYREVYGEAMTADSPTRHLAAVLVRRTPVGLDIPLTVVSAREADDTFWITLAATILPGENALDWLVRPPKLAALPEAHRSDVRDACLATAECVRRTANGLMMVGREPAAALKHSTLVLPHLKSAARWILQGDGRALSTSVWESNFAAENAVKCCLYQTGHPRVPNLHDVRRLARIYSSSMPDPEVDAALAIMPTGAEAVQYRYAELGPLSVDVAMLFYQASLVICRHFANAVPPKKFKLENASFKMQGPPRIELTKR